jgi:hypothetical protein
MYHEYYATKMWEARLRQNNRAGLHHVELPLTGARISTFSRGMVRVGAVFVSVGHWLQTQGGIVVAEAEAMAATSPSAAPASDCC